MTSSSVDVGTFEFVRIPAKDDDVIEVVTVKNTGGLMNDALLQYVKTYFSTHRGSGLVDIFALTVPTPVNGNRAVSVYTLQEANVLEAGNVNRRANELIVACGHNPGSRVVLGDAFVGRVHDDEERDIWNRVDFPLVDADPRTAAWCETARGLGGGGGSGKTSNGSGSNSLSGLLAQLSAKDGNSNRSPPVFTQGGMQEAANEATLNKSKYGANGAPPVEDSWGTWTQTNEEVELKFSVPGGVKAKDCQVTFHRQTLRVVVQGKVLLPSENSSTESSKNVRLFDPVEVDECTFTLNDKSDGTRDLCVTLGKTDSRTWPFVVSPIVKN